MILMQRRRWTLGFILLVIAISNMAFTPAVTPASASNPPPGPDRFTIIAVDYTVYEWQLLTWKGKKPVCSIIIDHDGMPVPGEIYKDCGQTVMIVIIQGVNFNWLLLEIGRASWRETL